MYKLRIYNLSIFLAYWITHRACKYVFDDIDDLIKAPEPIDYIWSAMQNYFNVTDRNSILAYFYAKFDKSTIAGFTKEVAVGCEKEDPLCLKLFEEAGQILAKHVIAVSKKAHNVSILISDSKPTRFAYDKITELQTIAVELMIKSQLLYNLLSIYKIRYVLSCSITFLDIHIYRDINSSAKYLLQIF